MRDKYVYIAVGVMSGVAALALFVVFMPCRELRARIRALVVHLDIMSFSHRCVMFGLFVSSAALMNFVRMSIHINAYSCTDLFI